MRLSLINDLLGAILEAISGLYDFRDACREMRDGFSIGRDGNLPRVACGSLFPVAINPRLNYIAY